MTIVRCAHCSTPNDVRRVRCRGCEKTLRRPESHVISLKPGSRPALAVSGKADEDRLLVDVQLRRLQEKESAAKRRLYEWEKRLTAWEVNLQRRANALAVRSRDSGTSPEVPKEEPSRSTPQGPWRSVLGGPGSISRIATHVPGLDEALRGGVPAGSVVLVSGSPGTMKTSLGLAILASNAISDGRRGLYITFGQRARSVLSQMENLGLDVPRTAGLLDILDATLLSRSAARGERDWLNGLRARVNEMARDRLELLVLDSLDALEVVAKFANRRVELFRLFEWLRDLKLTSFVIAERPDYIVRGNVFQGRHDEDFLADGMIQLRLHPVTDVEVQRRIRIVKMRGTAHDTGYMSFHVSPGKEFEVAPAIGA